MWMPYKITYSNIKIMVQIFKSDNKGKAIIKPEKKKTDQR